MGVLRTAVSAAGGFFIGGVLFRLLQGQPIGRMFAGSRAEMLVQGALAALAVAWVR